VIQDLDGSASEPSRRRHVAVLSTAVAAAATVLLSTLVAPAPRADMAPLAASPAPTPVTHTVVTFASDSATWIRPDQWSPFIVGRPADETWTVCMAGPGANPTVHLLFDREGKPMAAYTGGATGRFIAWRDFWGMGMLTVPCDTSDAFAPRMNRAR
jgi:hypothetical protein